MTSRKPPRILFAAGVFAIVIVLLVLVVAVLIFKDDSSSERSYTPPEQSIIEVNPQESSEPAPTPPDVPSRTEIRQGGEPAVDVAISGRVVDSSRSGCAECKHRVVGRQEGIDIRW